MKGIVVELNRNEAVILSDEGIFTTVKNKKYAVGQAIMIKENRKTYSKFVAGAASLAAAFAFCTIGAYAWFTPTDYVSVDVNPSVEYSLNTFGRILETKAVNDDGKKILEDLDLSNMNIEDGIRKTLDKLMERGYLTGDPDGGVVIATSSKGDLKEAEQLADELEQEVKSYLNENKEITAKVDAEAVAPERVKEAKALGVTPGKLNLVKKLQASTTGAISTEEWLPKPVKEINKAIKENRKADKSKEKIKDQSNQEKSGEDHGADVSGKPDKEDKESQTDKSEADQ